LEQQKLARGSRSPGEKDDLSERKKDRGQAAVASNAQSREKKGEINKRGGGKQTSSKRKTSQSKMRLTSFRKRIEERTGGAQGNHERLQTKCKHCFT